MLCRDDHTAVFLMARIGSGDDKLMSLDGFLEEFFTGNHPLLTQAYDPTVIRFFILQAHYRSTLDFSNEALQAAEKGLQRLMEAYTRIDKLKAGVTSRLAKH